MTAQIGDIYKYSNLEYTIEKIRTAERMRDRMRAELRIKS